LKIARQSQNESSTGS